MPIQHLEGDTSLYDHIKGFPQPKASIFQRIIANIHNLHIFHRQQLIDILPTQRKIIMIHNKHLQFGDIVKPLNKLYSILRAIDDL
jgi:hypothetical protein